MYVSSCKSVDMIMDIVKYEEGFFIVVKINGGYDLLIMFL